MGDDAAARGAMPARKQRKLRATMFPAPQTWRSMPSAPQATLYSTTLPSVFTSVLALSVTVKGWILAS